MKKKEGKIEGFFNSKSKTFLAFCFCLVGGMIGGVLGDVERGEVIVITGVVLVSLVMIIIMRKCKAVIVLWMFVFLLIGVARSGWQVEVNDNIEETCLWQGKITSEAEDRVDYVNYLVKVNGIGKVLLRADRYPQYLYGEEIKFNCRLRNIYTGEVNNYYRYLQMRGIDYLCYYPKNINKIGRASQGRILGWIYTAKKNIASRVNTLWPEPYSSFMAGLLYGSRSGFPADLGDNFNRVGITHIIAISGYNITLIIVFTNLVLIQIGLYRQQAFWLSICTIIVFIIFVGSSASVMRAGMMGILVLVSQGVGRRTTSFNIVVIALAIMGLFNPYALLYDVGFQLSYLATIGLIYLNPILQRLIKFEVISSTLSALIFTLPLIIFQFERVSIVALPVNILVLWLIPYIMLFGFIAVLLNFLIPQTINIFADIALVGLQYVIVLTNYIGSLSWSSVETKMTLSSLIISYLFLLIILIYVQKKIRSNEI